MSELVHHWRSQYDWRKAEAKLNEMPQFVVNIDGLDIHFIHQRSKHENARPLILIHGWPGSFYECSRILPRLTDPTQYGGTEEDAFHVVCPSIPGYGFSQRPHKPGYSQKQAAITFIKLMKILNYPKYIAQGGDWGAFIATFMSTLDSEHMMGLHLNMIPVGPPWKKSLFWTIGSYLLPSWFLEKDELPAFYDSFRVMVQETGYFHEQSTWPQTLGYGLNDSPVGLLAWIGEKLYRWSDHGNSSDVSNWLNKDELLTWITIYWVTGTSTSSMRFYYEFWFSGEKLYESLGGMDIETPTGFAIFPKEISTPPRSWTEYAFKNIVSWTKYNKGGHFAAMEEPQLLAEDIRAFVRKLRDQSSKKTEL